MGEVVKKRASPKWSSPHIYLATITGQGAGGKDEELTDGAYERNTKAKETVEEQEEQMRD